MDKISVIMGVYNPKDKNKLNNAIFSILNQTYKDIELIICDDCSNLETKEILRNWGKKDSRVILIENSENLGLAASLNHCLEFATGNYIGRQDDDDISKPNRFEEEMIFLKNHLEYDFVGCNLELIDEKCNIWGHRKHLECPEKKDFLFGNQFPHPAMLFTRKSLNAVNGYRAIKITRRTEDYDLFMRLYAEGFKGYNIQKYLYQYSEDEYGYRKQKLKYRIDEFFLRIEDFKLLGLMPKGIFYIFKPIISGLVPKKIIKIIKQNKYK